MLYTAGIVISFFLCLLLIWKQKKTVADRLLAFWLFWMGLHLLGSYLVFSGKTFEFPQLLGLTIPMPLLHPPILFLYTFALCRGRLPRRWWLHFVPVLASFIYMIPFFMRPAEEKIWVFQNRGVGYEQFMFLVNIGISVSGVAYTIMAHLLLLRHRRVIGDLFSYQEKINLQWMQNLIYGLAVIWLAVLMENESLVFGGAVFFVIFIGFFGIRQVGIFSSQLPEEVFKFAGHLPDVHLLDTKKELDPFSENKLALSPQTEEPPQEILPSPNRKKYEKSGLTPESATNLHQRLQDLMTEQKLFREPELSLTDLAERLGTHPNYLSQIINEAEGKNFYDFVNSMRVEAFLKMAAEPEGQRFTLLALAYDCGFNSKSAFNRYFKKATGRSPSEFLK